MHADARTLYSLYNWHGVEILLMDERCRRKLLDKFPGENLVTVLLVSPIDSYDLRQERREYADD